MPQTIRIERTHSPKAEYHTQKWDESEKERHYFSAMHYIDDYIGWDDLASYFLPSCHKKCRVVSNGNEYIVPYIDSWTREYNKDGFLRYTRVKVRIDKPQGFFRKTFLVQDYIEEDNI